MTPWELAKETEHSHQRAIFAWANCAAMYGIEIACSPAGYSVMTRPPLPFDPSGRGYPRCGVLELLHAIHNQGHGDAIRGAQAKAEGVKPGVPDIFLPVPEPRIAPVPPGVNDWWHGLYIELKAPAVVGKRKKGVTNEEQEKFIPRLRDQGYKVVVAVGWIEAVNAIMEYIGHDNRI